MGASSSSSTSGRVNREPSSADITRVGKMDGKGSPSFAIPELCGELAVAEPCAWLFGRRRWRRYFCSLEDGKRPLLRCYALKSGRLSHVYALAKSIAFEEPQKLTRLGYAKGRLKIRIAIGGHPWLFLSAEDSVQHSRWLKNLQILLPNKGLEEDNSQSAVLKGTKTSPASNSSNNDRIFTTN